MWLREPVRVVEKNGISPKNFGEPSYRDPMCNLYEIPDEFTLREQFGAELPGASWPRTAAPLSQAVFIKAKREAVVGQWGMIPPSSKERIPKTKEGRRMSTNNASGALLTVRSGKSACSHDLVTVSCGSGRSDCLNWR